MMENRLANGLVIFLIVPYNNLFTLLLLFNQNFVRNLKK